MGSQLDPLLLSRVGSRELLPSPNFPQLHVGEPSSGFTLGLGSASGEPSSGFTPGLGSVSIRLGRGTNYLVIRSCIKTNRHVG
jgi:hypothetical protein